MAKVTERSEGPTERTRGVRGHAPPENFEKLDAFSCILRHGNLGPTVEAVMKSVLSVICPGKILQPRF